MHLLTCVYVYMAMCLVKYRIHLYMCCGLYSLYSIRRHDSDVYLGMSPIQNGGSYLMY